jgi:hypothetical protein
MLCKPFRILVNVLAVWWLTACVAYGQTRGLAYASDAASSYENVPVPELVYARFGKSTDPLVREQVALGMLNKGVNLMRIGEAAESAATYDLGQQQQQPKAERATYAQIDREYGQHQELVLKEKLADTQFEDMLAKASQSR